MKWRTMAILFALFSGLLISCSQQPEEAIEADLGLKPGDKIGDMTITTADDWFWEQTLDPYCDYPVELPRIGEVQCQARPGDHLYINCMGDMEDSTEEIDEHWDTYELGLTIDDQIVDLPSFGTIELDVESENEVARMPNVVLRNLTAGEHTVHCIADYGDDGGSWDYTFLFVVAETEETLTELPAQPIPGQHAFTSEKTGLSFQLYVPEQYGEDPEQQWPLILYLHGYSKGLRNVELITDEGLPSVLEETSDFPFVVVSPLRDEGYFEYWQQEENITPMFELIEEIQSLYSIDPKRIYFSGGSGGASGVWEIGLQYPERFAAFVPVSGYYGYPFEVPENICDLKDVPIWAFHGAKDETVPIEAQQMLVDALDECGGNVRFTVIPDGGHSLDDQQIYNTELIEWLQEQMLR